MPYQDENFTSSEEGEVACTWKLPEFPGPQPFAPGPKIVKGPLYIGKIGPGKHTHFRTLVPNL